MFGWHWYYDVGVGAQAPHLAGQEHCHLQNKQWVTPHLAGKEHDADDLPHQSLGIPVQIRLQNIAPELR